MSENERIVNDQEIQDYKEDKHDTVQRDSHAAIMERYIDNSLKAGEQMTRYNQDARSLYNSPTNKGVKNTDSQQYSGLAAAGQQAVNTSGYNLLDKESNAPIKNLSQYQEPSPKKLEHVRQNMERRDAIKYRANTNNRGYGFEQITDQT